MSNKNFTEELLQLDEVEKKFLSIAEKELKEAEFADQANVLFEKNLAAFKKYFPDIADKFSVHQPSDKFDLFLCDSGLANIIDYNTGVPFYRDAIAEQIEEQIQHVINNPVFSKINYGFLEELDNEYDFIHVDLIKEIGAAYNKAKNELSNNTCLSGKLPSVVVFGIGLGYHLDKILNEFPCAYLNIFEPEEDYFFASLFTFEWHRYLEAIDESGVSLYLSIGVDEEETYRALYSRAQQIGPFTISNSLFYQHYPSKLIDNLIFKIRDNFHEFFMGWGFIDDAFMSLAHSCANVKNRIPFFHAHNSLTNKYKDFPVFIVANGPSLDRDIEKIKALQGEVLIIACNSATTALLENGIIPDFHAALERSRATYDFLEVFIPKQYRDQIGLLTVNVMHQDVAGLFGWAGAALKGREAGTSLHQIAEIFSRKTASATIAYCNPLVGNMALSYAVSLGFKNVYLFGVDNGYIDPKHHHSKSSMYYNNEGDTVYEPMQIGSKLQVEGNFGEKVIADQFLYSGKVQMERLLLTPKAKGMSCFNCSNGAKINGATPLLSEDIIFEKMNINKKQVISYIKNELFYVPDSDFDLEDFLDFENFEKLCVTLVEVLEDEVTTREEAFEQILKHIQLLVSLKETRFGHHYMVLEGEALYLNSIIINMLFNYGNDTEILPYYQNVKKIWCDFLSQAPELYRQNWNKASDHVFKV
ncbi:6-hydroxymethylpterin diphosphokinase MptE-like protein [Pseudoalteromonas mariniglutinosa]|uniref:motility associated factor glycosyltransferase family protein n=1 Tax=Pseudoalteromonas mariniglutinosa TaxID=206042 RepID=UPI00384BDD1A